MPSVIHVFVIPYVAICLGVVLINTNYNYNYTFTICCGAIHFVVLQIIYVITCAIQNKLNNPIVIWFVLLLIFRQGQVHNMKLDNVHDLIILNLDHVVMLVMYMDTFHLDPSNDHEDVMYINLGLAVISTMRICFLLDYLYSGWYGYYMIAWLCMFVPLIVSVVVYPEIQKKLD